jgi:hypothetical protein
MIIEPSAEHLCWLKKMEQALTKMPPSRQVSLASCLSWYQPMFNGSSIAAFPEEFKDCLERLPLEDLPLLYATILAEPIPDFLFNQLRLSIIEARMTGIL